MEGTHQWDPTGMSAGTSAACHAYQWLLVKFHIFFQQKIVQKLYFTQSKENCKEFQKALTILHNQVI